MNIRLRVLDAFIERLEPIRRNGGYATDSGNTLFVGETPQLGADDPPEAIAIVPQETAPSRDRFELWDIEVQALAKADLKQPYLSAMTALDDIVKAMELEFLTDRTLGGLVKHITVGPQRTLQREPGSTTVGVVQTYRVSYVREWGSV